MSVAEWCIVVFAKLVVSVLSSMRWLMCGEKTRSHVYDISPFQIKRYLLFCKLCIKIYTLRVRKLSLNCLFAGQKIISLTFLSSPGNQLDNLTKGPGRDFANFSLVSVIRRWSSARELGIELFCGVRVVQRIEKNVGIKDMIKENGRKACCVSKATERQTKPGKI